MKTINKFISGGILFFSILCPSFSQEALKSLEEEYYSFLSLYGTTKRNYLSYRTLSDSVWDLNTEDYIEKIKNDENPDPLYHPWKDNILGSNFILWEAETSNNNFFTKGIYEGIKLRLYGPESYNSYNTTTPFGQNDGALWQGRGYNTSLSLGARLESYGFELTFKPQITFSQNLAYDYMKPEATSNANYAGKADTYGYIYGYGCDAVQRFGENAFWTYSWGDTEIRWSWHSFTMGFGWQSIWLGQNQFNALLHSNNAPSYPKIDFGLRKQKIVIPFVNWDLGYIEGRIWSGFLTESEYFDNNPDNDHNLIHGLSLSYSPSFMPGFTINANRTCLVQATWENMGYIWPEYTNTYIGATDGSGEDQKMSITADWVFDKVGFEIYGEIGIDDFLPSGNSFILGYLRWPFHTATYAVGARKAFNHKNPSIKSELLFEWDNSEPSQDYQMWGTYNFGFHGQIHQGYTNGGQWLGNGYGYGGNSQTLQYRLYYPKGITSFTIGRNNPDNSYVFGQSVNHAAVEDKGYGGGYYVAARWLTAFKANFYADIDTKFFVTPNLVLGAGLTQHLIINPEYNPQKDSSNRYRINTLKNNLQVRLTAKYNF